MRQSDQERCSGYLAAAMADRAAIGVAEAKFFDGLMAFERDEDAWRCTGHATFYEVLDREGIVESYRFDKYKQSVAQFGHDVVLANGPKPMAIVLAVPPDAVSIKNPDRLARDEILGEIKTFREKQGTTPSEWNTERIANRHHVKPVMPRKVTTADKEVAAKVAALAKAKTKVLTLAEQLKAAKATIAERDREIAALKKEVARLLRLTSDQAAE